MPDVSIAGYVVGGIFGGSLFTALGVLITSRATSRKTDVEATVLEARAPAEKDSVVVQGAEAAVLTMRAALEDARADNAQLRADRERDRTRIEQLEARVVSLQATLTEAQQALSGLRVELDRFVAEQNHQHQQAGKA